MEPRLSALPRAVREALSRVTEKEVLDDPAVVAATNKERELDRLAENHAAGIETRRAALVEARGTIDKLTAEIAEIMGARRDLAMRAIRGDQQADSLDRNAQAKLADLVRLQSLLQAGYDEEHDDIERKSINPYGDRCAMAAAERGEAIFAARVARAEELTW